MLVKKKITLLTVREMKRKRKRNENENENERSGSQFVEEKTKDIKCLATHKVVL